MWCGISFDYDSTWWALCQKHIVRTNIYIYVFNCFTILVNSFLFVDNQFPWFLLVQSNHEIRCTSKCVNNKGSHLQVSNPWIDTVTIGYEWWIYHKTLTNEIKPSYIIITIIDLIWLDFWCFNATFSNISAISWRPVLVVEEAGVPGENHRPWASNW